MVAHETPPCTVTDEVPSLLPRPAHHRPAEGAPLPARPVFEPRFAAVRSARLEAAVRRLAGVSGAGTAPVPLDIDVAREGRRHPALDDDESYRLEIRPAGVRLEAPYEWGALRGLATLAQLCLAGPRMAPQVIEDRPRFPWRGLMLDVARHFLPLDALLRTLDAMALFKLNVLHLHLADDQGFRFLSGRYPELASAEHYAPEELQRLVAHAAALGIRVVPELDVPGHAASWLEAHPEWGSGTAAPTRRFGVHRECLDPTRAPVREAVATLFGEIAEVFPDAYVHLGGDEVHPAWWRDDPAIGRFMAARGLADVAALQAWFTREVAAVLESLGRVPLGWDEVLHPDLPDSAAVQAWRGVTARDRALAAGHDCVLSAPYYLDLFYPADVHYGFDPAAAEAELVARENALLDDPRFAHVAAGMAWTRQWRDIEPPGDAAPDRGRLLGAEACLWAELVDARVLDLRLWSRMPALAESFWSPAEPQNAAGLRRRLQGAQAQLSAWCGIDIERDRRAAAAAAGLDGGLAPLAEALEPVKWYGRLLGEAALAARLEGREMPLARPYDADTPLNRLADLLPPECAVTAALAEDLAAEAAGDGAARSRLRALADRWRHLPEPELGEVTGAAAALRDLGACVLGVLDGQLDVSSARARVEAAARPFGEYLLGPAPWLLSWLDRRAAGERAG